MTKRFLSPIDHCLSTLTDAKIGDAYLIGRHGSEGCSMTAGRGAWKRPVGVEDRMVRSSEMGEGRGEGGEMAPSATLRL